MADLNRRGFLKTATAVGLSGVGLLASRQAAAAEGGKRKFTMDLRCGAIGVKADLREAIRLAHQYGFESVEPSAPTLAKLSDAELGELLADLKGKNLVWGAAGLPVDFRGDESKFQDDLKQLPDLAAALQRAGVTRVGTWISPTHNSLTYVANFRQHARRLHEVAKILGDCGQRFGLEYVGPKTSWTKGRYPFVHTMAETKDLLAEIGRDNVGFVLDSWHWYTAEETEADLLTLTGHDVVACDLNDAPAGIPVDEQMDGSRELPAATGVIDLAAFLGALVKIGYNGPVRAEPFNKKLLAMPNEEAMAATAAAMKKAFALVE
ncbi:MAG TPA: sugar phosphate isomerase/epimerase family protein [Thermoguttaceae bacterium]|nr:sugar phosphate isomerase/epimerase family protein [Thermoguttaceae bacterium]